MPELGLPHKRFSFVDEDGVWHAVASGMHRYNTIEYYEEAQPDRATFFMGIIERTDHVPALTRIAFRVERSRLVELESFLREIGGRNVERNDDFEEYPAIFFEDPAGTKLEVVARAARTLEIAV